MIQVQRMLFFAGLATIVTRQGTAENKPDNIFLQTNHGQTQEPGF
jgi:hypothetical protein